MTTQTEGNPEYVEIQNWTGAKVKLRKCRCGSSDLEFGGEAMASWVWCKGCSRSTFNVMFPSAITLWNNGLDSPPRARDDRP